jgi:LacI family transcriptional regulator
LKLEDSVAKRKSNKNQVTLKVLAGHLGLAPGTISKVLNNANGSEAISQPTKTRIVAAARRFQYRPNFLAQSLRTKRTYMIGVLVLEIGDPASALVIAGIERFLRQRGYLCMTGVHRNNEDILEAYGNLFLRRGVEGLITVDADFPYRSRLATVAIAVPRSWTAKNSVGTVDDFGRSLQSRRFLERVGETAADALLRQVERHGDGTLSGDPELMMHDRPHPTAVMSNG